MFSLENASFYLRVDPSQNLFSVEPRQKNAPSLNNAHFSVRYRRGLAWHLQEDVLPTDVGESTDISSPHGDLRSRSVRFGPNRHALVFEVTFALARTQPLLLWRLKINNLGSTSIDIGRIELLRVGFAPASQANPRRNAPDYPRGDYTFPFMGAVPAFFSNGWGSWNHTGAFGFTDHFRRTRFGWFNGPMRVNPGTPQPRAAGHFASDMYAVIGDRANRGGLLVGFLSQKEHFGTIEVLTNPLTPALSLWANGDNTRLEPGDAIQTDWACLQPVHLDDPDPLAPYLEAVARENGLIGSEVGPLPVGWCSWYQYYQNISVSIIRQNLDSAAEIAARIPLDLIQIDDGWQAQIGDWDRFSPGFSSGVISLAAEIKEKGMTPGLWLAPFILHPQSDLIRSRPNWILRNAINLPVNAGFVWNTFTRALDISQDEVLDHTIEIVHRAAEDWHYPYLKLDFLYAGALNGKRADRYRSRAQILRSAFEKIRDAVGEEVTLLACGSPLGPAIGIFDAMRINADVAPHWSPRFMGHERIFRSEPDFPSARNAIQNTLTRAPMHQRWWINDPDCLLIRPDSDLSLAEVRSLATAIGMTGGSILLSDDLTRLPVERLAIAKQMLPPIGRRPQVLDWFDTGMPARLRLDLKGPAGDWSLLALFNWSDRPVDLRIFLSDFNMNAAKTYVGREFWTGEIMGFEGGSTTFGETAAHGCILFAVRPLSVGPQYIGSDLHISQGLEVEEWKAETGRLMIRLRSAGRASGMIFVRFPGEPDSPEFVAVGNDVYSLNVDFRETLKVDVGYSV